MLLSNLCIVFQKCCSFVEEEGVSFEPWWEVREQMQDIWNREGPNKGVDSVRCNRVSLRVKSSLGISLSSSIKFNEIRLAYINCPRLYYIYFIYYIILYSFKIASGAYMVCGACFCCFCKTFYVPDCLMGSSPDQGLRP